MRYADGSLADMVALRDIEASRYRAVPPRTFFRVRKRFDMALKSFKSIQIFRNVKKCLNYVQWLNRSIYLEEHGKKEGEELNLAYVSPSTPLPERLAALWKTWGFVCTCRRRDKLFTSEISWS